MIFIFIPALFSLCSKAGVFSTDPSQTDGRLCFPTPKRSVWAYNSSLEQSGHNLGTSLFPIYSSALLLTHQAPIRTWSKVGHCVGNGVPFQTQPTHNCTHQLSCKRSESCHMNNIYLDVAYLFGCSGHKPWSRRATKCTDFCSIPALTHLILPNKASMSWMRCSAKLGQNPARNVTLQDLDWRTLKYMMCFFLIST